MSKEMIIPVGYEITEVRTKRSKRVIKIILPEDYGSFLNNTYTKFSLHCVLFKDKRKVVFLNDIEKGWEIEIHNPSILKELETKRKLK